MIVSASDLRNNFSEYLSKVTENNEEVIITKNNVRVARLVPYVSDIERYFTVKENAINYDYERKTISFDEFMEIYEKSNTRMEFINGEIYVLSSPSIFHQAVLGNLYIVFKEYFKDKKCKPFLAPFDVIFRKKDIRDPNSIKDIKEPDLLQPDLIVLCDLENNINEKGRYTGIPSLTLEILSASTKNIDLIYKLNTYMTSGVSEYWIVDPDNKTIMIYSFKNYRIDKNDFYKMGEIAKSFKFEGLSVNVESIFEELF